MCEPRGVARGVPGFLECPSHTSILHCVNFLSDLTAILITDQTAFGDLEGGGGGGPGKKREKKKLKE